MTVEVQLKKGDFGDSVSEVVVVEWLKQVGQTIAADGELVELESDKATTHCLCFRCLFRNQHPPAYRE